jgi:hypothetical protein
MNFFFFLTFEDRSSEIQNTNIKLSYYLITLPLITGCVKIDKIVIQDLLETPFSRKRIAEYFR